MKKRLLDDLRWLVEHNVPKRVLEAIGYGLIVAAAAVVAVPLGLLAGGLVALNYALWS